MALVVIEMWLLSYPEEAGIPKRGYELKNGAGLGLRDVDLVDKLQSHKSFCIIAVTGQQLTK